MRGGAPARGQDGGDVHRPRHQRARVSAPEAAGGVPGAVPRAGEEGRLAVPQGPDEVQPPFLIISSQTSVENSDKQSYNFDVTLQFDIVYRTFKSGEVGQKSVDQWANELLGIIGVNVPDYPSASPDFKIVTLAPLSLPVTINIVCN